MKYEVMTYNCSAGDYHVVYVFFGIQKLAVLMAVDRAEIDSFLSEQKDVTEVNWTCYVPGEGTWIKTNCKECD